MKQKLTAAIRNRITENWRAAFPTMVAAFPMWLMKRHGPIVVGLCLDRTRSNDCYIPVFHVHCLVRPSLNVSLTLYQALSDERVPQIEQEIDVVSHASTFAGHVVRMRRQVPILLQPRLAMNEVLALYVEFFLARRDPAVCRFPSTLFADVILTLAALGHRERATDLFMKASRLMETWPRHEVRPSSWHEDISARLDFDAAASTVASELKRHKLEAIPDYGLDPGIDDAETIIDLYGKTV